MIERLRIVGLKSIRDAELELRPLNVLIGPNGAGKSNLIFALRMLNALAEGRFQTFVAKRGGASALLHHGPKVSNQIQLHVTFGSGASEEAAYRADVVFTSGDRLKVAFEGIRHGGAERFHGRLSPEQFVEESALRDLYPVAAMDMGALAEQLRLVRDYHFNDTTPEAAMKRTADLKGNNRLLERDGRNLAAVLFGLQRSDPGTFQRIRDVVRLAAPFLDDFVLKPHPENPESILLRWREKGDEHDQGADALSDGTLRFICLATVLLQKELPRVIVIDEPELGLHPYAIHVLVDMLESAATQTQVIVTTQSPTLLDNLTDPESVVVVERDRKLNDTVFRRVSAPELEIWLADYSLGEVWNKNILGGHP